MHLEIQIHLNDVTITKKQSEASHIWSRRKKLYKKNLLRTASILKLKYLKLGISKNFWSIKSTFHNFFFLSYLVDISIPTCCLLTMFLWYYLTNRRSHSWQHNEVTGIDCKLLCCLSTKSLKDREKGTRYEESILICSFGDRIMVCVHLASFSGDRIMVH